MISYIYYTKNRRKSNSLSTTFLTSLAPVFDRFDSHVGVVKKQEGCFEHPSHFLTTISNFM